MLEYLSVLKPFEWGCLESVVLFLGFPKPKAQEQMCKKLIQQSILYKIGISYIITMSSCLAYYLLTVASQQIISYVKSYV